VGTLVGTKVGRFRVDRELGRGGMGAVYAAFDERLERDVALKVLLVSDASDDERRRFIREARLAAKLTHPNIASVYEVDEIDGRIVIIMELLEGESLRNLLSKRKLQMDEAISLARDVARALARAHGSGVIHRDIKPENVFVTEPAPGALHAKVLDFGLARQKDPAMSLKAGDGNESTMSQTWGTPGYMSPEQANREAVDVRTDIFAFGTLFYEMVAGIRAFRAANELGVLAAVLRSEPRALSQIVPDVAAPVEEIVVRCLKKDRNARFADGKELSAALEAFARPISTGSFRAIIDPKTVESSPSHGSVTATKDPPAPFHLHLDLRDPTTKKRVMIGGAACAVMLLIGLVAIAASGPSTPKPADSATAASAAPAEPPIPDPFIIPPPPPVAAPPEPAAETVADIDEPPATASSAPAAAAVPVKAKPKSKAADCKTPFTVDAKGVKIPKMHCL